MYYWTFLTTNRQVIKSYLVLEDLQMKVDSRKQFHENMKKINTLSLIENSINLETLNFHISLTDL